SDRDDESISEMEEAKATTGTESKSGSSSSITAAGESSITPTELTNKPRDGDIGAGALSVNGLSPFLKDEGLVHLTVRDAIDTVLSRAAVWEKDTSASEQSSSSIDSIAKEI
ncbi:hypothetical protein BGW38_005713, partial [Lunasporangiospora selenospora]